MTSNGLWITDPVHLRGSDQGFVQSDQFFHSEPVLYGLDPQTAATTQLEAHKSLESHCVCSIGIWIYYTLKNAGLF